MTEAVAEAMTKTVTEANEAIKANEATKTNALVRTAKTVKIVSLASRQKKNNIVKKITSVLIIAVLVIRIETAACCITRTVCSLDVRITTRRKFNRFVVISRISLTRSDLTLEPSPHAPPPTATILTTTMSILPTARTRTESLAEPPSCQKTTRAPRQHRSRPRAFS